MKKNFTAYTVIELLLGALALAALGQALADPNPAYIGAALIGPAAITFADWAARADDDGKIATIINLLSQSNEVLKDMLVIEANQATSHKTTVRTGLPSGTWRLLNYGVSQTKSTTAQVVDSCGNLE